MRAMQYERVVSMYDVQTHAPGPAGSLPLDDEFLLAAPSGDLFGLTQDAGMGWDPSLLRRKEFLILSTQGGIRSPDGTPDRAGLPHGPLGGRAADAGGGAGIRGAGRRSRLRALSPTPATAAPRARRA